MNSARDFSAIPRWFSSSAAGTRKSQKQTERGGVRRPNKAGEVAHILRRILYPATTPVLTLLTRAKCCILLSSAMLRWLCRVPSICHITTGMPSGSATGWHYKASLQSC